MTLAYYNEFDPKAAAWLRELIRRGLIAPGDVDERSITDVRPDDLRGYTQCHFFAGIGVWSYSLRRAGWPDSRPVWTGSCPCQPFSAVGKSGGFADERHLWPAMHWLIDQCRPDIWLGEQVASKDGLAWLDLVCDDLETTGYAIGAIDTSSALTGAPHIRQRLRIGAKRLGDAAGAGRVGWRSIKARDGRGRALAATDGSGEVGRLADADGGDAGAQWQQRGGQQRQQPQDGGAGIGLADADHARPQGWLIGRDGTGERAAGPRGVELQDQRAGQIDRFWADADWLFCRDGRWRPVEPGTFPLVDGTPARVGRLRGYGNAVDAIATAHFIAAFDEALDGLMRGERPAPTTLFDYLEAAE